MTKSHARQRMVQLLAGAIVLAGLTGCSQSVSDAPTTARPGSPTAPPDKPAQVAPSQQEDPGRSEDVTERDGDRHPSKWKKKLRALYA